MKHPPLLRRSFSNALMAIPLVAASAMGADAPPRAEVAGLQYFRAQAAGLDKELPRPGTQVKLLLTHGDSNWRALDVESSRVMSFVDGAGANLAISDAADIGAVPAGIQPQECSVSADGQKAVVTIWGGGLPATGVDQIKVSGTVAIFCGPSDELSVDWAGVRATGGETFNVQPFRVVTFRGEDHLELELRYLKSAAFIRDVSIATPAGQLASVGTGSQVSSGDEWVWKGDFLLPPRASSVHLTVRYLPISKVETVPFDQTVGLAFGAPTTNPLFRWVKKFL